MLYRLATLALVGFFVYVQTASAAMSSTSYGIRWDTFSTGGSDTSSSASYLLRDSVSGAAGQTATSTNYQIADGYRSGVYDQIISFDLYIQNSANEQPASALAGLTATVDSTSGYSVGNYAAIVQDRGGQSVVGFGKIASLTGTTVTFDRLSTGASSPTVDGSNDYLYVLTGSALAIEPIEANSVGIGLVGFEMTVDNDNGYSIQVLEDGNLANGANEINDVTDGEVTAGSEEFGARSSDQTVSGSTFDTQDTAITSTAQDIVTKSTFAFSERSFLQFKLAANTGTPSATYANSMTFIASGNF